MRNGLISRAIEEQHVSIEPIQLRNFAINQHGQVDDTPYGGGSGMVMRPESATAAIEHAKEKDPSAKVILFTPRGRPLTQEKARGLLAENRGLILLCPRYEGVDERIVESLVDEELSIGDYILMGGEIPAMVLIEAVTRLIPGVLNNSESTVYESFEDGMLEHPQYTKPQSYRGQEVPPVLLSGDHKKIEEWRKDRSLKDTIERRPDLIKKPSLPSCEVSVALIHHPVMDKQGDIITSSITNMDLHDIARSCRTFGIPHFYVVHPTRMLRKLAQKICDHWATGYGFEYNPNRSDALSTISLMPDFDDVLIDIERRSGSLPKIITTSARPSAKAQTFNEMRAHLLSATEPHLILFGTGWGLADDILNRANFHIEPIVGPTDYNHLSVRAAAAIILDRLFGSK